MKSVYSVTQINSYIKNMFRQDYMLQSILVRGEVSNCTYQSSGHIYFTLKDEGGTLKCAMWSSSIRNGGLKFQMKEGDRVIAAGAVDVYEKTGSYQFYAKQIIRDGAGELNEKYEKLKSELEARGMFDEQYKLPIPKYIKRLGVVTAPTGAAPAGDLRSGTRGAGADHAGEAQPTGGGGGGALRPGYRPALG